MHWQYTLPELFPNKVSQTFVQGPVPVDWLDLSTKKLHVPSPSTPKWQWHEDSDCRRRSQWPPQLWHLHCGPPRRHSTRIFDHLDILMTRAKFLGTPMCSSQHQVLVFCMFLIREPQKNSYIIHSYIHPCFSPNNLEQTDLKQPTVYLVLLLMLYIII